MSACSCGSEPNNFTLPLISSNKALGGSMLTKEVKVCACRQSFRSGAAKDSSCAIAGNTAAYHSCFGRCRLRAGGADAGGARTTGEETGERRGRASANKSAVRDFAERNFTGHQDPPGRAGRPAL